MHIALNHLNLVILSNELDVEWAGDIESISNLPGSLFDSAYSLGIKVLRGKEESSVARVDAGILNVLGIKCINILPSLATASISIPFAFSIYLVMTAGCSRETSAACLRYEARPSLE